MSSLPMRSQKPRQPDEQRHGAFGRAKMPPLNQRCRQCQGRGGHQPRDAPPPEYHRPRWPAKRLPPAPGKISTADKVADSARANQCQASAVVAVAKLATRQGAEAIGPGRYRHGIQEADAPRHQGTEPRAQGFPHPGASRVLHPSSARTKTQRQRQQSQKPHSAAIPCRVTP